MVQGSPFGKYLPKWARAAHRGQGLVQDHTAQSGDFTSSLAAEMLEVPLRSRDGKRENVLDILRPPGKLVEPGEALFLPLASATEEPAREQGTL